MSWHSTDASSLLSFNLSPLKFAFYSRTGRSASSDFRSVWGGVLNSLVPSNTSWSITSALEIATKYRPIYIMVHIVHLTIKSLGRIWWQLLSQIFFYRTTYIVPIVEILENYSHIVTATYLFFPSQHPVHLHSNSFTIFWICRRLNTENNSKDKKWIRTYQKQILSQPLISRHSGFTYTTWYVCELLSSVIVSCPQVGSWKHLEHSDHI